MRFLSPINLIMLRKNQDGMGGYTQEFVYDEIIYVHLYDSIKEVKNLDNEIEHSDTIKFVARENLSLGTIIEHEGIKYQVGTKFPFGILITYTCERYKN